MKYNSDLCCYFMSLHFSKRTLLLGRDFVNISRPLLVHFNQACSQEENMILHICALLLTILRHEAIFLYLICFEALIFL